MNAENLQQRILKVLAETLDSNPATIKPEHELKQDIGCDSLDCVEIMMALEEEFEIEIDDDKFEKLTTVQHVIDYVAGVCNIKQSPAERTAFFDHEDIATVQITKCITHHQACHCRELKFSLLSKVAQDWLKNEFYTHPEKRSELEQLVERTRAALNNLAADTTAHEPPANAQGGPGWAAL